MEPQLVDYYNEMPHGVHVIDKLNDEYEESLENIDNYYLYNVLDDQLYRLHCPYENLQKIVHKLVKTRYIDKDELDSDESFVAYLREEGLMS